MKLIKVGKAEFTLTDGEIGVMASGGLDSSVLMYILMTNLDPDQRLHIYSFGKLKTHYSAISGARIAAKRCSELTGFTNYEHHVDYDDDQTIEFLFRQIKDDYANGGQITCLYNGMTANPPKEIAESFAEAGGYESTENDWRDPTVHRDIMFNKKLCVPFTNLNKKDIAEIYEELGVTETLIPYTRSCENYDPKYLGAHCGVCWWCGERNWGFGRFE